ncbi:MAG: transporter associated domain-containing protein, partial [Tepidanaerobacteraceae bacterium]|nr:transporter associated domain-containing protein [Tepidanaerobacteraceae bacterium]
SSKIVKGVFFLEAVLALFIAFGVLIGVTDIIRYFKIIYITAPMETFPVMQTFLGHILTLVIGLELTIMLVRHTPSSVIEVLLYAIARKMIIESKSMVDILLGIVAIGGLFLINKIFDPARNFITDSNIVNPATLVTDLNKRLEVKIPSDLGNTIGGVVAKLCHESGEKLENGKTLRIADAEITILSMDDELIRELKVIKQEEKDDIYREI